MKTLNYSPEEKGVCSGLASMAAQAVLRKDGHTFYERIKRVHAASPEMIESCKNYKTNEENNINAIDLHAFFDELSLYQGPSSVHEDFRNIIPSFHQSINNVSKIASGESSKFPYINASFASKLTRSELETFLLEIKGRLNGEPFSLLLHTVKHVVQIGFDGKAWMLVDHDEVEYLEDLKKILSLRNAFTGRFEIITSDENRKIPIDKKFRANIKNLSDGELKELVYALSYVNSSDQLKKILAISYL